MNGFKAYKKFNKLDKELDYKAEDLYLFLLGNSKRTVNNVFLNTPTDKHNKEIYLQVQILFNLRETFLKNWLKRESSIMISINQTQQDKNMKNVLQKKQNQNQN